MRCFQECVSGCTINVLFLFSNDVIRELIKYHHLKTSDTVDQRVAGVKLMSYKAEESDNGGWVWSGRFYRGVWDYYGDEHLVFLEFRSLQGTELWNRILFNVDWSIIERSDSIFNSKVYWTVCCCSLITVIKKDKGSLFLWMFIHLLTLILVMNNAALWTHQAKPKNYHSYVRRIGLTTINCIF